MERELEIGKMTKRRVGYLLHSAAWTFQVILYLMEDDCAIPSISPHSKPYHVPLYCLRHKMEVKLWRKHFTSWTESVDEIYIVAIVLGNETKSHCPVT
jgi:hypothetical protein